MGSPLAGRSKVAAALGVVLACSGCLDLDALRDRRAEDGGSTDAAPALRQPDARVAPLSDAAIPDGCDLPNVRALRMWTLQIGQNDYVTLKNPTECPIDLRG